MIHMNDGHGNLNVNHLEAVHVNDLKKTSCKSFECKI